MPLASVRTWRFEPGLPRSVGFGPVCAPPFLPQPTRCRGRRAENRWRCGAPSGRGLRAGGGPRRRPPASPVGGANTSCRTHSPSPGAASPTGSPTAARRGCRSGPRGQADEVDRPSASADQAAAAAPPPPKAHQGRGACSCPPERTNLGFVRRSKSRRAAMSMSPAGHRRRRQTRRRLTLILDQEIQAPQSQCSIQICPDHSMGAGHHACPTPPSRSCNSSTERGCRGLRVPDNNPIQWAIRSPTGRTHMPFVDHPSQMRSPNPDRPSTRPNCRKWIRGSTSAALTSA